MDEPKRWEEVTDGFKHEMDPHPEGKWVLFDDPAIVRMMANDKALAAAGLLDAMQNDAIGFMRRELFGSPAYEASVAGKLEMEQRIFRDSDHGGSLGACYQAWRWAKGIA